VQGALNITATAGDPFTLELVTLTLADVPGSMVNFEPTTSYAWRIVRTQAGITGFGAGVITIDPAGFANMTDGTFSLSLENSGHDLMLRYIARPIISSFSPLSGPVGTEVMIEGTGLDTVTEVQFHGTPAVVVTPVSATSIKAVVPLGATTGPITVISPGGTGTSPASFKVLPKITSFTPTSAAVGETVTITGTTFTGATSVKFNTTSATFTVDSDTQITATVPVGATTGTISVTTPDGTGTSPASFGCCPELPVSLPPAPRRRVGDD